MSAPFLIAQLVPQQRKPQKRLEQMFTKVGRREDLSDIIAGHQALGQNVSLSVAGPSTSYNAGEVIK